MITICCKKIVANAQVTLEHAPTEQYLFVQDLYRRQRLLFLQQQVQRCSLTVQMGKIKRNRYERKPIEEPMQKIVLIQMIFRNFKKTYMVDKQTILSSKSRYAQKQQKITLGRVEELYILFDGLNRQNCLKQGIPCIANFYIMQEYKNRCKKRI